MFTKKLTALCLCAGFALLMGMPAFADGVEPGRFELPSLDLPCRSAVLIEQESGTVLYEKEMDRQVPIASITKLMTLLLTLEAVQEGRVSLEDHVPVSEHAYGTGGSQIWLEPGEEFTLDEMLRAICVCSANDAAVAVAEFIGGTEPAFVEMMNQKAQELGMNATTFKNACGLDTEGHISSARDVAIMSREILTKHPEITKYTTIWTDSLRGGETQLVNTNKLLKRYPGMTGLKTGTTSGAGVCLSASATRDGLSLIAVALGSPSSTERFTAASAMLDYGFANFESVPAPAPQNAPQSLPVTGGCAQNVELQYELPQNILVKKGEGEALESHFTGPEQIAAPVEKGAELGRVSVTAGGQELGSWPVRAKQDVPALTMHFAVQQLWQALLIQ